MEQCDSRESLVETRHHAANGRTLLYHDHIETAVGTVKGLTAYRDRLTAADNQYPLLILKTPDRGFILHGLGNGYSKPRPMPLCVGWPGCTLTRLAHPGAFHRTC